MSGLAYALQIFDGGKWSDLRDNPLPGGVTASDDLHEASRQARRLAERAAHRIRVVQTAGGLVVDEYDADGNQVEKFSDD